MPSPVLNERTLEKAPRRRGRRPKPARRTKPPINDGPISTVAAAGDDGQRHDRQDGRAVRAPAGERRRRLDQHRLARDRRNADGELVYNYSSRRSAMVGRLRRLRARVRCCMFKPHLAKFLGPVYAIAEGFFVGAISKVYETFYNGIVVQAAGATIAVFGVMLVLYRTRIIKVTERFRRIVIIATLGIMVFYGVCFLIRLFAGSGSVSFLATPRLLGIGFSVFVAAWRR